MTKFWENESRYELPQEHGCIAQAKAEHRANQLNAQQNLTDRDVQRITSAGRQALVSRESLRRAGRSPACTQVHA
jgi:hypothetical protein